MLEIDLGRDDSGDRHVLYALRSLHHRPDVLCGCNPDHVDHPLDASFEGFWGHHAFPAEVDVQTETVCVNRALLLIVLVHAERAAPKSRAARLIREQIEASDA